MRTIQQSLQDHLDGAVLTLATLWRITRRDGAVMAFTDHDRDIGYDGHTHRASSGFLPSAYQAEIGLDVPNMSFQGALVADAITADDILAGVYDAALLEVFIVNYADLSQGHLPLLVAIFGQADLVDLDRYEIEVRSLKTLLDQPAGILTTPKCRHVFGDAGCQYAVDTEKVAGTITAAGGATACTDSNRGEPARHFFNGRLKFTTGANAGYQRDIIDHGAGGAFTFMLPFPRAIAVGDHYEAWPGCLYTFADCRDRWANTLNFGGFPHVPGRDDVLLYPDPR